ncbi:MAG: glucuronate isomerase [Planctomycetota bacterium]
MTASAVQEIFAAESVVDMHTHLFAPAFNAAGDGRFLLWGIDELLCYHYFTDEILRVLPGLTPVAYGAMPKAERADLVWRSLFVERSPVSEACIGVVETLTALGLDPGDRDLAGYRAWFAGRTLDAHVDEVMRLAGVERIVMTNELFDPAERAIWMDGGARLSDPRFSAVARFDALLENRPVAFKQLAELGYDVREDGGVSTFSEIRRFLADWVGRTGAVYLACSLSPWFRYPSASDAFQTRMIDECVVPAAHDAGVPLAMMIGAVRGVNPAMGQAGDGLGLADVSSVCRLAAAHPHLKLLITMLSRENQHELCVAARKFANITPFGCWWYVNTASMIEEITRVRLELLGTSFIPQHSDARVLEQLIYKWRQSRRLIAACVADRYAAMQAAGGQVDARDASADAARLLRGNFQALTGADS